MRVVAASVLGIALTFAMALCSGIPYRAERADEARVRLSWRALPERVEECRELSEEELAALPPHMRRKEICEGRTLPFRLEVAVDGETRFEGEVHAGGAREDRPAYVFQELSVAPGEHRLRVRFGAEGRRVLALDETVTFPPRGVLLVTHAPDADRLHAVLPAAN